MNYILYIVLYVKNLIIFKSSATKIQSIDRNTSDSKQIFSDTNPTTNICIQLNLIPNFSDKDAAKNLLASQS